MLRVNNLHKLTKLDLQGKFSIGYIWTKRVKNCPKKEGLSYFPTYLKIVDNEKLRCYLFSSSNILSVKNLVLELLS